jgi:hypothetical protein
MMQLQKTFKESYMKTLRDQVKSGESLQIYSGEDFKIDDSQVKRLSNVYAPEGLEEKLIPTSDGDFESSIAVYEAYKDISPLLASNETFWAYITHTTLFNYAQKRWPKVLDKTATSDYIIDHWFLGTNGLLRNAASSLWWSVYSTIDEERANKYELTEILFKNYTLRVVTLGSYTLIRHKQAMLGILGFLKDNPDITQKGFEYRGQYITKYFNRLGAYKQLVYMDKDFFYQTLEKIKDRIMSVMTREDINNDVLYNGI